MALATNRRRTLRRLLDHSQRRPLAPTRPLAAAPPILTSPAPLFGLRAADREWSESLPKFKASSGSLRPGREGTISKPTPLGFRCGSEAHALLRVLVSIRVAVVGAGGLIDPEHFSGEAREALAVASFLDRLIDGSRAQRVHVVDLRPIFRANKSPYLYQPDDSHWNPRAIALSAAALAEVVQGFDTSRVSSAAFGRS
ncbi:MAG: hypothetical protein ACE1ZP_03350 [Myxococcota bacterium]